MLSFVDFSSNVEVQQAEFTVNDVRAAASAHNNFLIRTINDYSPSGGFNDDQEFLDLLRSKSGLDNSTRSNIENYSSKDPRIHITSQVALGYYNAIMTDIQSYTNYSSLASKMDTHFNNALQNIPDYKERTAILLLAEVGKNQLIYGYLKTKEA